MSEHFSVFGKVLIAPFTPQLVQARVSLDGLLNIVPISAEKNLQKRDLLPFVASFTIYHNVHLTSMSQISTIHQQDFIKNKWFRLHRDQLKELFTQSAVLYERSQTHQLTKPNPNIQAARVRIIANDQQEQAKIAEEDESKRYWIENVDVFEEYKPYWQSFIRMWENWESCLPIT